jgi:predicted transcriptional regulator
MKNKLKTLLVFLWIGLTIVAQTPQGVIQNDKEQVNFWESNTAMIIGGVVILTLIIARTWSKRIHKRRDEIINDEKEEK